MATGRSFPPHVEQHIERALWLRIHYHYIGEGLSSEANFRAAMDIRQGPRASRPIAGMADIHKYQTERDDRETDPREPPTPRSLEFRITCQTDPELYDQPLTLETSAPQAGCEPSDDQAARGQMIRRAPGYRRFGSTWPRATRHTTSTRKLTRKFS